MSELHANGVVFKSRLVPVPPICAANISLGAGPGPHSDAGKWDSASPPSPKPRLSVLSWRSEVKGQDKLIKARPFRRMASRRREKGVGEAGEGEQREGNGIFKCQFYSRFTKINAFPMASLGLSTSVL